MRITSKSQVSIPIEIREKAGLLPGTEVDFELDGEGIRREGRGAAGRDAGAGDGPAFAGQRHREDVDRRDHGLDPWRGLIPSSSTAM